MDLAFLSLAFYKSFYCRVPVSPLCSKFVFHEALDLKKKNNLNEAPAIVILRAQPVAMMNIIFLTVCRSFQVVGLVFVCQQYEICGAENLANCAVFSSELPCSVGLQ